MTAKYDIPRYLQLQLWGINCVGAEAIMRDSASLMRLHSSRMLVRPTPGQVGCDNVCHAAIPASLRLSTPPHCLQLQRQSSPSPHGRAAARAGSTRSISHRHSRRKAAASVGSSHVAQVRLPLGWPIQGEYALCRGMPPTHRRLRLAGSGLQGGRSSRAWQACQGGLPATWPHLGWARLQSAEQSCRAWTRRSHHCWGASILRQAAGGRRG